MSKQQIHKRLEREQVITILENYLAGEIRAKDAINNLEIRKSRFYEIVREYKNNPDDFSLQYSREKPSRAISQEAEAQILAELKFEQKLIKNKNNPIKFYNYSAINDILLDKHNVKVSLPTIINRAKDNGFYLGKPKKKVHDREVLTNLAGELVQGDSSHHQWSPYMPNKLYLITYIDDYSRLILFADLFEKETVWPHIRALKSIFTKYGCPLKFYVDQHAIFRYVKDRDKNSPWNNFSCFTDDTSPQWKQVLEDCGVKVIYALSPQAKGKVERPYRWIQDRLVRIAAREKLTSIDELRKVLKELINQYNTKWVHSTTKEIPIIRFENAIQKNQSLFKSLKLDKPNQTLDDIFCLRGKRIVDAYRKISLNGYELRVPGGTPRYTVDLKIVPDYENKLVNIRFWQENKFLGAQTEKLENFKSVRF